MNSNLTSFGTSISKWQRKANELNMSEEFTFRPLEKNDRSIIMEIAKNTWNGNDHLPKMFEEWLSNPNCHTVGLIIEDRLAGLGCARIIEHGKTAWLEGLRVHPDFHGRGYSRPITFELRDIAKQLGAKRTRLTSALENPVPGKLARSIGMKMKISFDVRWIGVQDHFKMNEIEYSVTECSAEEFIEKAARNSSLELHKILLYFWYAIDLDENAITVLLSNEGIRFSNESGNPESTGVALGFPRNNENNTEWCTTIYPSKEDSLVPLLKHQALFCKEAGIPNMMYQYPSSFNSFMKEIGWEDKTGHGITLALFEGTL